MRRTLQSCASALAITLGLAGCAGMSDTQQRVVSGGAAGAVGGTVIGAIAGNAGLGAAIGAVAGGTGGYVWDRHKKSEESAYQRGVQDGATRTR